MTTVLVVDDQARARRLLGARLEAQGFSVIEATDGEDGWQRFCQAPPSVVITDVAMPRCDGIELLRRIRSRSDVPVIVCSKSGSIRSAAEAFKAGADDFVDVLDVEMDELVGRIECSARGEEKAPASDALEERLAGGSAGIARIRWQLAGLAPLSTPVLVRGERGTGRSLAIESLHTLGSTARGRLRVFDAARFVPADFADPGTVGAVHLRDVEELAPDAQRYWRHRLEREERSSLAPTLRLFASTAVSLTDRVQRGLFDAALARSLLRFEVEMPPLRERPGDVPDIARSLLRRIGRTVGRARVQLSPAALRHLAECRFPDNILQLERLLERAVAYSPGRVIRKRTVEELMAELERSIAGMREEHQLRERERLLEALEETGGNITHTAERMEKSRAAIYRLIAKHDIPLTRPGRTATRYRPARAPGESCRVPRSSSPSNAPSCQARQICSNETSSRGSW